MLDDHWFSAATVANFGVGQWHMAALIAQVDDPIPETQVIVVRMLQGKEAERAAASSAAFDAWLAGYRGRLEQVVGRLETTGGQEIVRNCGRK